VGGWCRLRWAWWRWEVEVAYLRAEIEQPSLIPGVLLTQSLTSNQVGGALESEFGAPEAPVAGGLDLGFASGDSAPGFGAFPQTNGAAPLPGDLEGPQATLPTDTTVDNFRFHPDYRIDRILFREIIGTVTDAFYLHPHVKWRIARLGPGTFTASLATIASWAMEAQSTPGGEQGLGVELDPTLVYESDDGFLLSLEHAVLFPLAGLNNPIAGLDASPAQLFRARLMFIF